MEHSATIISDKQKVKLDQIDTASTKPHKVESDAKEELLRDVEALSEHQETLYAEGARSVLVILQGMDTSGKDSIIKHVMRGVNPQGCVVHSFKAPSQEELHHDYLWRHVRVLPSKGKIGIFNRSYYEDVTIVRVHRDILKNSNLRATDAVDPEIWKRRFDEINNFEKYLTQNGVVILKIFLHISPDEQKKRLLKRIEDPKKHWKFDVSDIRERQHWKHYQDAYEDAFNHTSTPWAPWIIVPSDHKWSARVTVAHLMVEAFERMKPQYPKLSPAGEEQLKTAKKLLVAE